MKAPKGDLAKWRIILYKGFCYVLGPGEPNHGSLIFEHASRRVVGLTQAYSTVSNDTKGNREMSKNTLAKQRVCAAEVAGRVIAKYGEGEGE